MPYRNTRRKNNRTNRNKRNKRKSRKTQSGGSDPIPSHEGANAFTDLTKYTINNTNKDAAATYFKKLLGDLSDHPKIKEIIDSDNANELTKLKNQILSLYLQKITKVDFANNLDNVIKNEGTLAKLNSLLSETAGASDATSGTAGTSDSTSGTAGTSDSTPPITGGTIELLKVVASPASATLEKFLNNPGTGAPAVLGPGVNLTFKNNKKGKDLLKNPEDFKSLHNRIPEELKILFPDNEDTKIKATLAGELFKSADTDGKDATKLINGIYYWAVTDNTGTKALTDFFTIELLDGEFGIKLTGKKEVNSRTMNESNDWFEELKKEIEGNESGNLAIKVHAVPRSLSDAPNAGGYIGTDNPRSLENPAIPEHKGALVFKIKDLVSNFKEGGDDDLIPFSKIVDKLKKIEISINIRPPPSSSSS